MVTLLCWTEDRLDARVSDDTILWCKVDLPGLRLFAYSASVNMKALQYTDVFRHIFLSYIFVIILGYSSMSQNLY